MYCMFDLRVIFVPCEYSTGSSQVWSSQLQFRVWVF